MRLEQGDCRYILKTVESNTVDSLVTDPPFGISFMSKKWDYDIPSVDLWKDVLRVMKPGSFGVVACGTRTQHRMAVNLEDAGFEIRDVIAHVYAGGFPKSLDVGKFVDKLQGIADSPFGSCEESKKHIKDTKGDSKWEGFGTALKPAMNLWTLIRKPLSEKTVAENVLKHGTGGINIDGCRIGTEDTLHPSSSKKMKFGGNSMFESKTMNDPDWVQNSQGRWPSNFIHDGSEEVMSLFPETKSGDGCVRTQEGSFLEHGGLGKAGDVQRSYGDQGSAARFFFCAKASPSEKSKGLEGFKYKEDIYILKDNTSQENIKKIKDFLVNVEKSNER